MRVKMLMRRRLEWDGETQHLLEGETYDIPDGVASDWIRRGVAEAVNDKPSVSPMPKPAPEEKPERPAPRFNRQRKDPDENKSEDDESGESED